MVLTAGFLALLLTISPEQLRNPETLAPLVWKLDWAFILFVAGGVTDILDGQFARRYNATSAFGRKFDPLTDKILILGGFGVLAWFGSEITAVSWWIVGIIFGRELLVTVMRHVSESQGRAFAATWAGKVKMFLQSFAAGTALIYTGHYQGVDWATRLRDTSVWAAALFTVITILLYFPRMRQIRWGGKSETTQG